jgi:hypothetical protein
MSRRGQCRCGLVLKFRRTAQGYKMRCPSCGAVVRLRTCKPRRKSTPTEEPAILPPPETEAPLPDDIDVELVPAWDLPDETPPKPSRHRQAVLVGALAGCAALAIGASIAWFLLH